MHEAKSILLVEIKKLQLVSKTLKSAINPDVISVAGVKVEDAGGDQKAAACGIAAALAIRRRP